ncbi:phasin family protein [Dankookia rubra]|nr:phasin family protein [Dankookia rubra]
MATVTEAKVASTPAPRARPRAKAIEAMAEADETAPAAPEPGIGTVAAKAALPETQAPLEAAAEHAAIEAAPQVLPPAGTISDAAPAQPTRMTMETTMEQATKATEGFLKAAEQATEFTRGNFEAMTKATQLYVAGVQDLGKQTMAMFQGLADHGVAGAKALGSVKSLKEAAEIQATFARAAVEKSLAESAKLQEAALKLAETSFAPLSARMTLAVESFGKPLAA